MAHIHKSDAEYIANTHNVARFFTEHRHVALILLLATFVWGWFGYRNMPKHKDPNIPVRVASAQCQWPGATTEQVEQLVTRPIEHAVALNSTLKPPSHSDFGIRSLSVPGLSVVYVQLNDNVKVKEKQFSDMNLKLNQLDLPRGAGPIQVNSKFGDTAALMLTVASPMVTPTEVALRAIAIRNAIVRTRAELRRNAPQPRVSIIYAFPLSVAAGPVRTDFENIAGNAAKNKTFSDLHYFEGPGYVGLDASTMFDDATIRQRGEQLILQNLHRSEIHPDFIEERHAIGEPFEEAVIDAGIIRLRPVMITVGATVLALFPLAMHGGPLWQPLCYAQIGGLTVATFITLLMVPVLYSIFVLDLKILTWDEKEENREGTVVVPPSTAPVTSGD